MRKYLIAGAGFHCGQNFSRVSVAGQTAIELSGETHGNTVYGFIVNNGEYRYMPTGRIKIRTLASNIEELD